MFRACTRLAQCRRSRVACFRVQVSAAARRARPARRVRQWGAACVLRGGGRLGGGGLGGGGLAEGRLADSLGAAG